MLWKLKLQRRPAKQTIVEISFVFVLNMYLEAKRARATRTPAQLLMKKEIDAFNQENAKQCKIQPYFTRDALAFLIGEDDGSWKHVSRLIS